MKIPLPDREEVWVNMGLARTKQMKSCGIFINFIRKGFVCLYKLVYVFYYIIL